MGGNAIGIAAILGLVGLREVVGEARRIEAELIRRLAVVDRERFYLHEAASSMFAYMTERLGFAEGAAYKRIRVARLSLVVPAVVDALESGRVHLSGLHALAPVLSPANADELLDWAAGKSKKLIEAHVDAMRRRAGEKQSAPRPRIRPVVIRRGEAKAKAAAAGAATVPEPSLFGASTQPPAKPAAEQPAAEKPAARPDPVEVLFELSLTMTQGLREKWEKASGLMGHRGGASRVLEAALDLLIERLEKERFGAPAAGKAKRPSKQQPKQQPEQQSTPESKPEPKPELKPKSKSNPDSKPARYIPNAIKRAVYDRDEGRCTFVDAAGHRCGSRVVELHHMEAFGRGGEHNVSNITLHCPRHNTLEAEREYGEEAMKQYRQPS